MDTPAAQPEKQTAQENEFRISPKTHVPTAIKRMEEIYDKYDHFIISGINAGISRALLFVEIFRLRFTGFYQYNSIETITIEMKEENSEPKADDRKRYLTRFKVEIYKNKPANPKGFYQKPYTEEEVKKLKEFKAEEKEGERRGGFRGRGRGRGRGFRGRGRGRGGERGGRGMRGERGRGRGRGERGGRGMRGERGGRGRGERRDGPFRGERGGRGMRGRGRGGADKPDNGPSDDYVPGLGNKKGTKTGLKK